MASKVAVLPDSIIDAFQSLTIGGSVSNQSYSSGNAPKLVFLTLPHPRTNAPSLFLPVQQIDNQEETTSILELQAVDPPASRSWFMDNDTVLEDGRLLLMSPVDPAFILLPILLAVNPNDGTGNFRTIDDIFNTAANKLAPTDKSDTKGDQDPLSHGDILHLSSLSFVPSTLSRLCEAKELDNEVTVYRFSPPKVTQLLRDKASRLASPEVVSRVRSLSRSLARDGLGPDETVDDKIREAGRLKVACQVLSQYLPPSIKSALLKSYDFTELDKYVGTIQKEELPAVAVSKKGNSQSSTSKASKTETSAAGSKKRKAETQVSRGAQKLQKTDTSKMTKLTSFFTKKPADSG
ncbi:hypothetical protein CPB86DRAFT_729439 [Serendipita vermifera]|nr:hypothetical protein CPB86DRAFT_729439 [Serendipita vermifera]